MAQIPQVEQELKQEPIPPLTDLKAHGPAIDSKSSTRSLVSKMPFKVKLVRITDADIQKYTKQTATTASTPPTVHTPMKQGEHQVKRLTIPVRKLPLTPKQSVQIKTPKRCGNPTITRAKTRSQQGAKGKKHVISGHPSQLRLPPQYTFQIHQHVLRK